MANNNNKKKNSQLQELKELCEADLYSFCSYVNPDRVYGEVHKEMMEFLSFDNGKNKLCLIPRAHQKSHVIAMFCAWEITRNPAITILYLSATAELAESQLYDIKNILTSDRYRALWPEMVNEEDGKRHLWRQNAVAVDHPFRKSEGIRDATIKTAGLTTNTTGWHADLIIPDDLVVPDNAYTEDGRKKVRSGASQLASIKNPGGRTCAVGTRYHPKDIYFTWRNQMYDVYDDEGNEIGRENLWEIMERKVETNGLFLWPSSRRGRDGKKFGFDLQELAKKRGEYDDPIHYFAQYYNDPNDSSTNRIKRELFQYYEEMFLRRKGGNWFFNGKELNIYASIDFAYSLKKSADYTAIVVIGIDGDGNIYILDIDRFKTDSISEYFKHISALHSKWHFRKLRAETNVAQVVIVRDLKKYISRNGLVLSIEESRSVGKKEERIAAALDHKYENGSMWHFSGGLTPSLEEELMLAKPPHDDIKDALASAVEIAIPPMSFDDEDEDDNVVQFNSRFRGN